MTELETQKTNELLIPKLVKKEHCPLRLEPITKINKNTEIIEIMDEEASTDIEDFLSENIINKVTECTLLPSTVMIMIANMCQFNETVLLTKIILNVDVLSKDFKQVPHPRKRETIVRYNDK